MKYLLFMGEDYYPQGGAEDFVKGFDSLEEAHAEADKLRSAPIVGSQFKNTYYDWANILCVETGKVWGNNLSKDVWGEVFEEEE